MEELESMTGKEKLLGVQSSNVAEVQTTGNQNEVIMNGQWSLITGYHSGLSASTKIPK
ncbi:hypothetical protein Bca4012_082887 [Brassica carinata]